MCFCLTGEPSDTDHIASTNPFWWSAIRTTIPGIYKCILRDCQHFKDETCMKAMFSTSHLGWMKDTKQWACFGSYVPIGSVEMNEDEFELINEWDLLSDVSLEIYPEQLD